MNMNIQPSELMRQHQAHLARQARFARAAVKPAPVIVALPAPVVEAKPKVKRERRVTAKTVEPVKMINLKDFTTSLSRCVEWGGNYCPYAGGSAELVRFRSMRDIALSVLRKYPDITLDEIKGSSRNRHLVLARHNIVYAIKKERPHFSFPQIGRFLGNRDHTTCMNSFNKFKQLVDANMVSL